MIKVSRFGNDCLSTHMFESYKDLKIWVEKEIEQFKIKNCVRNEEKDRYFINFKNEMELILLKFKNYEHE